MINPCDLDHLVLKEDKGPSNNEVFAPDPDTVLFLTDTLLKEEQAKEHFVSTPMRPKEKTVDEEISVETKHQGCFRLVQEK